MIALAGCYLSEDENDGLSAPSLSTIHTVSDIPIPQGYERVSKKKNSFADWLLSVPVKSDKRVFLYDGTLKRDQTVQYAVLDLPVGTQNLQQCADAIMRMRAEYLFSQQRYPEIKFRDNNDTWYCWQGADDRQKFELYLKKVFGMCGTASLEKQLSVTRPLKDVQAGDVFIKGGFPGHAMLVVDVAVSKEGKRIYMLAQGYMPAQDIHIVNNPRNALLGPWYEVNDDAIIETPEWTFKKGQLRGWE